MKGAKVVEPNEGDLVGQATREIGEALEPFDRDTQSRIMEAVCVLLGEDDLATLLRAARTATQAAERRQPKANA